MINGAIKNSNSHRHTHILSPTEYVKHTTGERQIIFVSLIRRCWKFIQKKHFHCSSVIINTFFSIDIFDEQFFFACLAMFDPFMNRIDFIVDWIHFEWDERVSLKFVSKKASMLSIHLIFVCQVRKKWKYFSFKFNCYTISINYFLLMKWNFLFLVATGDNYNFWLHSKF